MWFGLRKRVAELEKWKITVTWPWVTVPAPIDDEHDSISVHLGTEIASVRAQLEVLRADWLRHVQLAAKEQIRVNAKFSALESKPDPHYIALEPPGCGPEGVHIGAEIVALRKRLEKFDAREKIVAAIVEGCRAGNEHVENLIAELSRKLPLVEKAVIDQNDAAVHHLGEWQRRVEAIENGTAPGVQTTLADLSDRIQDLVETAAQVSEYLLLLAALNGKKLGMSPYEPERPPVPILLPLEAKHKKDK